MGPINIGSNMLLHMPWVNHCRTHVTRTYVRWLLLFALIKCGYPCLIASLRSNMNWHCKSMHMDASSKRL